jgi:hypothetical protein
LKVYYTEIWQGLGIAKKSFYRYLNADFEHDRRIKSQRMPDEEVLNRTVILRDRFDKMFRVERDG